MSCYQLIVTITIYHKNKSFIHSLELVTIVIVVNVVIGRFSGGGLL